MKQLFCYLSLLCALIFTYAVHAQTITVTVTAPPYSPGAGSGSGMDGYTPTGSAVANMGNNASFITQAKADAMALACDNIEGAFLQCKRDTQDIYTRATSNCGYFTLGGGTMGAGAALGLGGLALLGSNPGGWVILGIIGVGAVGGGTAGWGASSCYSDPGAIRDKNLAICDSNQLKTKQMCGK